MSAVRFSDWPERLAVFVEARQDQAFAWGSNDCATHAADCVLELTGADPFDQLTPNPRGTWSDEAGALALLESLGGLLSAGDALLGSRLRSPRLAQRGDVVLVSEPVPEDAPDGTEPLRYLAVCLGTDFAAPNSTGYLRGPMAWAAVAWPVGRVA